MRDFLEMNTEEKRYDEMPFFDDDISELADLLLNVEGIRKLRYMRHDKAWIRKVGDDSLKECLLEMTELQIHIIEALVFDDKCILDIKNEKCMSLKEIRIEIGKMHRSLIKRM